MGEEKANKEAEKAEGAEKAVEGEYESANNEHLDSSYEDEVLEVQPTEVYEFVILL